LPSQPGLEVYMHMYITSHYHHNQQDLVLTFSIIICTGSMIWWSSEITNTYTKTTSPDQLTKWV